MKTKAQISFIGLFVIFCSGCCSLLTHEFANSSEIYGGVHYDTHLIFHPDSTFNVLGGSADLPFSFLADTLYLPFDLANQPPSVDPLKGWKCWNEWDEEPHPALYGGPQHMLVNRAQPAKHSLLDKAIKDDYQNYLQKHQHGYFSIEGPTFYEDGIGRHAVKIQVGNGGRYTIYIFIYDKSNTRTKIIKYPNGGYAC